MIAVRVWFGIGITRVSLYYLCYITSLYKKNIQRKRAAARVYTFYFVITTRQHIMFHLYLNTRRFKFSRQTDSFEKKYIPEILNTHAQEDAYVFD